MYSKNLALQFTTTDTALRKLNEEIRNLIGQRLVTYEASLQISSREYFANCIEEFLASYSVAMNECSSSIRNIAYRIKRRMKATLMSFYDYIVRGLWLLKESPRCKEQLEDYYFIPEAFDIDSLNDLVDEIKQSDGFENCIDDAQYRELIHCIHSNLLSGLKEIKHIVDGDMKGKVFAVNRWVVRFRSDIRELRGIYEQKWNRCVERLSLERLQDMKDETEDELTDSDFYIEDIHDTDSLVEHIHRLQRKCCAAELDRFLYNYALVEYLEERIKCMKPSNKQVTIINYGDNYFSNGATQYGDININKQ